MLDIKVSKNHMNIVNSLMVFSPPNKNPRNLSNTVQEIDPSNRNKSILVLHLDIIMDLKNINDPEINNIHLVSTPTKHDQHNRHSKNTKHSKTYTS